MRNFTVCTVCPIQSRFNESKILRWTGHVARMEEDRSAFKTLTSEPKRKRSSGRLRCRWKENITTYFK